MVVLEKRRFCDDGGLCIAVWDGLCAYVADRQLLEKKIDY
jgi:hypothetical protein